MIAFHVSLIPKKKFQWKLLSHFFGICLLVTGCQATTAKIDVISTQDRAKFKSNLPSCPTNFSIRTWSSCVGSIVAFNDQSKYIGEFKNGKKHGRGIYTSNKGSKYVGEWKNDKLDGFGTFNFWFGDKYTGEWKDDKFNGWGVWIKANQEKYVGGFRDGIKHGTGTITFADGRVQDGLWESGKLLSEQNIRLPVTVYCNSERNLKKCPK